MLPDETTASKNIVLSDKTDLVNKTVGMLPDDTVSESTVLSDETNNNKHLLSVLNTTSTDMYPDTTATASTLHEPTDTPNEDISAKTLSSEDVDIKTKNNVTNKINNDVSLDATTEVLPDETMCPSSPLPEATMQNSNSNTNVRQESVQMELDSQDSTKQMTDKGYQKE